ncbi:MoaD/ThiS family protein [Dethiobacter alkaliphilus]|uniref:MoaD/ThiS family protein n=1 Tax=Dethiobacter alkaliphilus TaxID=427926 RepID=UPI0022263AF4|nr:MoaD/ThiS family protein [Dethiobacter alkaliphilus]MCW3489501.1 MoaD/ThiS family protein [Dethiobacter alkaliphilus]
MILSIHVYATLRRYTKQVSGQAIELEMPLGSTGLDVLAKLKIPRAEVQLFIVDGTVSKPEMILSDGSRIGILPPIAGG